MNIQKDIKKFLPLALVTALFININCIENTPNTQSKKDKNLLFYLLNKSNTNNEALIKYRNMASKVIAETKSQCFSFSDDKFKYKGNEKNTDEIVSLISSDYNQNLTNSNNNAENWMDSVNVGIFNNFSPITGASYDTTANQATYKGKKFAECDFQNKTDALSLVKKVNQNLIDATGESGLTLTSTDTLFQFVYNGVTKTISVNDIQDITTFKEWILDVKNEILIGAILNIAYSYTNNNFTCGPYTIDRDTINSSATKLSTWRNDCVAKLIDATVDVNTKTFTYRGHNFTYSDLGIGDVVDMANPIPQTNFMNRVNEIDLILADWTFAGLIYTYTVGSTTINIPSATISALTGSGFTYTDLLELKLDADGKEIAIATNGYQGVFVSYNAGTNNYMVHNASHILPRAGNTVVTIKAFIDALVLTPPVLVSADIYASIGGLTNKNIPSYPRVITATSEWGLTSGKAEICINPGVEVCLSPTTNIYAGNPTTLSNDVFTIPSIASLTANPLFDVNNATIYTKITLTDVKGNTSVDNIFSTLRINSFDVMTPPTSSIPAPVYLDDIKHCSTNTGRFYKAGFNPLNELIIQTFNGVTESSINTGYIRGALWQDFACQIDNDKEFHIFGGNNGISPNTNGLVITDITQPVATLPSITYTYPSVPSDLRNMGNNCYSLPNGAGYKTNCLGGEDNSGNPMAKIYTFDSLTRTWTIQASNLAMKNICLATSGTNLWVTCGNLNAMYKSSDGGITFGAPIGTLKTMRPGDGDTKGYMARVGTNPAVTFIIIGGQTVGSNKVEIFDNRNSLYPLALQADFYKEGNVNSYGETSIGRIGNGGNNSIEIRNQKNIIGVPFNYDLYFGAYNP